MNNDDEVYILLLLSDSNLPTGSFVASAGLESYATHGFFASSSLSLSRDKLDATTEFVRDSLATYARSALPFVSDAYGIVEKLVTGYSDGDEEEELEGATSDINALDDLYEAMTLNHVARRASKSQGVALLTLFSKGFTKPSFLHSRSSEPSAESEMHTRREARTFKFVERYKLRVRREHSHGHLPVCWGVLAAALGLSLGTRSLTPASPLLMPVVIELAPARCQSLHLFLHARSILSASVRLNTLGPYAAQQLLLHAVRPLVEAEAARCHHLRTGYFKMSEPANAQSADDFDETINGPAVTWPLGEILATRHDLQHSRIFNS
ncbi:hypothetical protein AcW1_004915 [Taiwanofungus camphoratus]|nr:hypothetical protein AcV7_002947 [Antrodia cinnamomea]KAI0960390.1 hypothetical protein AcW1_004915 [Antrodia cinnamomea]